jgi:hypothetical protein
LGLGLIFHKMMFRADRSAVRFERGGRVGVSMFRFLEAQGFIGNHLFVRSPEELARLRLRELLFTLE